MPKYNFYCEECEFVDVKYLSINEFLKTKNIIKCQDCQKTLTHIITTTINTQVSKSTDQIKFDSEDSVRKTLNKIESGNRRVIEDIYGDRPNPHKIKGH